MKIKKLLSIYLGRRSILKKKITYVFMTTQVENCGNLEVLVHFQPTDLALKYEYSYTLILQLKFTGKGMPATNKG